MTPVVRLDSQVADGPRTVFVEDWAATYGSPYLVQPDEPLHADVELVEDGSRLVAHPGVPPSREVDIAFVDGVRRGEASLYQHNHATGAVTYGVAGGHACGAVLGDGQTLSFGETRVRRLVIWGAGLTGVLPPIRGGWWWVPASVASSAPDAPLKELQTRMREDEGRLAEDLCERGYLVVIDGPLNFVRSRELPVVGYVKTHYRALLPEEHHSRIPELQAGERTSLFRLGSDRYSCYLRLTRRSATSSPWFGIVRLEVPQSSGLSAAIEVTNHVAGAIPRYAGVAHRDPRAPQNLQPIGALEKHLRHLLGHAGLAARAVREAADALI
ncbi:hypothetical protein [Mycobacterium marinum]|uniref:hypothetical protein n=1 Tax=Mycobacterium marinum TaxID=1781 RepID=UPI003563B953